MFFKVAQKEMGYLGSFSNKIGHQEIFLLCCDKDVQLVPRVFFIFL